MHGIVKTRLLRLPLLLSALVLFSTDALTTSFASRRSSSSARNKPLGEGGLVRTAPDQQWEEIKGNYVLRPYSQSSRLLEDGTTTATTSSQQQQHRPPRAILHFLGGAFVGAAPHVSYRYMLERLANEGYLVVATPYNMSFDHLEMCATVHDRFEAVLPVLERQYGSDLFDKLPTVAVGHSCGSLLHLLMSTSLYTGNNNKGRMMQQTKKAANVFMSFNNKPAAESIPYFDELVAPISQYFSQSYYSENPNQLNFIRLAHEARAASDVSLLLQGLEKAEALAGRDFDFLLYELKRTAHLMYPISKVLPLKSPNALPPSVFSKAAQSGLSGLLRPAKRTLQTMTLINQVVDGMDQIPILLKQIADGANDFSPAPRSVKEFAKQSYQAPKTLILQYEEDGLDESEEIEHLLQSNHPTKNVSRRILQGGHGAPLFAPPLHVATSAERRMGHAKAKERLGYAQADATVAVLTKWLDKEAGIVPQRS